MEKRIGTKNRYRLDINGVDLGQVRKSMGGWESAGKVHETKAKAERYLMNKKKIVQVEGDTSEKFNRKMLDAIQDQLFRRMNPPK